MKNVSIFSYNKYDPVHNSCSPFLIIIMCEGYRGDVFAQFSQFTLDHKVLSFIEHSMFGVVCCFLIGKWGIRLPGSRRVDVLEIKSWRSGEVRRKDLMNRVESDEVHRKALMNRVESDEVRSKALMNRVESDEVRRKALVNRVESDEVRRKALINREWRTH